MQPSEELFPGYVAGSWKVDTAHSHIGFMVKHLMVSRVRGRFTNFSGEIVTTPNPLESQVHVRIESASIDTANKQRDDHVRSSDFLDTEQFPLIVFDSTEIREQGGGFIVAGDLTIRGVTRAVELATSVPEFGVSQRGGAKAGFEASTEINRFDFGVSYTGYLPGGDKTVGDRVQIFLEIEADLDSAHGLI
jgi:polyisoprenoid-binding protein YceI